MQSRVAYFHIEGENDCEKLPCTDENCDCNKCTNIYIGVRCKSRVEHFLSHFDQGLLSNSSISCPKVGIISKNIPLKIKTNQATLSFPCWG